MNYEKVFKDMVAKIEEEYQKVPSESNEKEVLDLLSSSVGRPFHFAQAQDGSRKLVVETKYTPYPEENIPVLTWDTYFNAHELYGDITVRKLNDDHEINLADALIDSSYAHDLMDYDYVNNQKYNLLVLETSKKHDAIPEKATDMSDRLAELYDDFSKKATQMGFDEKSIQRSIVDISKGHKAMYYYRILEGLENINECLIENGFYPLKFDEDYKFVPITDEKNLSNQDKALIDRLHKTVYGEEKITVKVKSGLEDDKLNAIMSGFSSAENDAVKAYLSTLQEKIQNDLGRFDKEFDVPAYMIGEFISAKNKTEINDFVYGNEKKGISACDKEDLTDLLDYVGANYPNYHIYENIRDNDTLDERDDI